MADVDLPGLHSNDPETCTSPKLQKANPRIRTSRKRQGAFALTFFVVYCVMLLALLVGNEGMQEWTIYVQVGVGSMLALLVFCEVAALLFIPSPTLHTLFIVSMFCLASVSLSVLDSQFSLSLETNSQVSFHLPSSFPMLAVLTTMPPFFHHEPLAVLLVGSLTNTICFAFHISAFQSAHPVLYVVIYEVGVIALAVKSDIASVENELRLIAMTDLSVSKGSSPKKPVAEEPVGSELEAILKGLKKVHSNAEEAVNAARSEDELQRARESEKLMRDLMQRLKTKNIYALLPEHITQNLSGDEKTYIEENYFPPPVPTRTIRRRDRLQSSNSYSAIEPMKYTLTELIPLLGQIGKQWNFDTDFLAACTDGHPVSKVGDYLFRILHLNKRLTLSPDLVMKFFEKIDEGYLPNAYHNSTHAADVMFSVMFLSKSSGLLFYSSDLEVAACVVATLGHDVGHLGFNNRYLVNSRHDLATNCIFHADNDMSVLEMMHASQTFKIATETRAFETLSADSWVLFRRQIVEMILATDMAKHFELLTQFRVTITTPQLDDQNTRFFLFKIFLKCGDIGHSAKTTELHERWSLRVMEEFFKQGDAEKERNLPVSMFCDRATTDIGKVSSTQSQKGFLENLAYPLFDAVATLLRCEVMVDMCVRQISKNAVFWHRKSRKRASTIQNESQVNLTLDKLRLSAANLLASDADSST